MQVKYYSRDEKQYAKFNSIEFVKHNNYYVHNTHGYLHRYIYQYYNPNINIEGYDIHHKDHNKMNNNISNLQLLTSSEHHSLHSGHKGELNPWYGQHHSLETIKKISEATSGEKNPMYGKNHSPETKQKISEANKGKKPWNYKTRTFEMYEDIKNRMKCKDFCLKYNVSHNVYYSIKKELKIKEDF